MVWSGHQVPSREEGLWRHTYEITIQKHLMKREIRKMRDYGSDMVCPGLEDWWGLKWKLQWSNRGCSDLIGAAKGGDEPSEGLLLLGVKLLMRSSTVRGLVGGWDEPSKRFLFLWGGGGCKAPEAAQGGSVCYKVRKNYLWFTSEHHSSFYPSGIIISISSADSAPSSVSASSSSAAS